MLCTYVCLVDCHSATLSGADLGAWLRACAGPLPGSTPLWARLVHAATLDGWLDGEPGIPVVRAAVALAATVQAPSAGRVEIEGDTVSYETCAGTRIVLLRHGEDVIALVVEGADPRSVLRRVLQALDGAWVEIPEELRTAARLTEADELEQRAYDLRA